MSTRSEPRISPLSAMSYGPYGLLKSLVAGFVLGSVVFLAFGIVQLDSEYDYPSQIRTWLYVIGIGCGFSLTITMLLNYIIGSRVQKELQRNRELFPPRNVQSQGRT